MGYGLDEERSHQIPLKITFYANYLKDLIDVECSVASSQLQIPQMVPEFMSLMSALLLSVACSSRSRVGFLQVFRVSPTSQKHSGEWIGYANSPPSVTECMFPPHTQRP